MSAFRSKADILGYQRGVLFTSNSGHQLSALCDVREVPKADIQMAVGYYCWCALWRSKTIPFNPVNRISTWIFRGEHFYIWLLGWPAYRQRLAMLGRKPIRPGQFVSSLAPFQAVLPTSLPA